jgi:hypothetical protein
LAQYQEAVRREFPDVPESAQFFIFLTKDQIEPSAKGWLRYSYADLHNVLDRCRRMNRAGIGGDVASFLDHYLRLIGSHFMPDKEIEELCRKIYRNHRQAIDLIFDNAGVSGSGLVAEIREWIEQDAGRWDIVGTSPSRVSFVPKCWKGKFPPIGSRSTFDPGSWLVLSIEINDAGCNFNVSAWPTTDRTLRRRVIDRLTEKREEFGLALFSRKILGDQWTRLSKEVISTWPDGEEPDGASTKSAIQGKLQTVYERLKDVPEKLGPLLKSGVGAAADLATPSE